MGNKNSHYNSFFLALILTGIQLSISGQPNQVKFDFTGLLKKKNSKIDSVSFGGYLVKDFILNTYSTNTHNFKYSTDSSASIIIYIGKNKYVLLYHKSFETKCAIGQSVTFEYYKRKRLFACIRDCTAKGRSIPMRKLKLDR